MKWCNTNYLFITCNTFFSFNGFKDSGNFSLIYWPKPKLQYICCFLYNESIHFVCWAWVLNVKVSDLSFVDCWSTASTAVIWRTLRRHWMSWLPHGKMSSVKWRYALNIFKVSVPYWCFRYAVLYIYTSSQQFEIHFCWKKNPYQGCIYLMKTH